VEAAVAAPVGCCPFAVNASIIVASNALNLTSVFMKTLM
jgi:hypothetical protein